MLKLSLKAGEYIKIGDNIRVVFAGGVGNNARLLIDAPREINIARSNALEQKDELPESMAAVNFHRETDISPEAKEKIRKILAEERKKSR